jgi:hypothetical protein
MLPVDELSVSDFPSYRKVNNECCAQVCALTSGVCEPPADVLDPPSGVSEFTADVCDPPAEIYGHKANTDVFRVPPADTEQDFNGRRLRSNPQKKRLRKSWIYPKLTFPKVSRTREGLAQQCFDIDDTIDNFLFWLKY